VADELESDMVMYPWIWYREICINDTYDCYVILDTLYKNIGCIVEKYCITILNFYKCYVHREKCWRPMLHTIRKIVIY
jgi:hypothetical protein